MSRAGVVCVCSRVPRAGARRCGETATAAHQYPKARVHGVLAQPVVEHTQRELACIGYNPYPHRERAPALRYFLRCGLPATITREDSPAPADVSLPTRERASLAKEEALLAGANAPAKGVHCSPNEMDWRRSLPRDVPAPTIAPRVPRSGAKGAAQRSCPLRFLALRERHTPTAPPSSTDAPRQTHRKAPGRVTPLRPCQPPFPGSRDALTPRLQAEQLCRHCRIRYVACSWSCL